MNWDKNDGLGWASTLGLGSLPGFPFGAGSRACGYHTVIDETGCVVGPQLEYSTVVIARG